MQWTRLPNQAEADYVLILEKGDELVAELNAFIESQDIEAARFSAIGGFSEVTLGYYDRRRQNFDRIPVKEQVEVLSLLGDVALQDGMPKAHMHVVLGKRNGIAMGGHVLAAKVWPTLEVMLTEIAPDLRRVVDRETGLALINPVGARRLAPRAGAEATGKH